MDIIEGMLVKSKDQRGVVIIPQKSYTTMVQYGPGTVVNETHYSLNNVLLEDGTIVMVGEDEIEEYKEEEDAGISEGTTSED